MSWLKDFLGGTASAVTGGLINFGFNKASTDHANDLNVKNYGQRYHLAVKDMQAAGLNPILAATSGIGGNIQGVSGFSASVPAIGSESSALANSALSRKNANNVDALAKSNIAANAASANKLDADAQSVRQATEFAGKYFPYELAAKGLVVDNARQQLQFLKSQTDRQDYERTVVLPALANMYTLQGVQAASSAALNEQNRELSKANTNLLGLQAYDYQKYGTSNHNLTGVAIPFTRVLDKIKKIYFDNPNR